MPNYDPLKFSNYELLEVFRTIDREKSPEDYAQLEEEINRRNSLEATPDNGMNSVRPSTKVMAALLPLMGFPVQVISYIVLFTAAVDNHRNIQAHSSLTVAMIAWLCIPAAGLFGIWIGIKGFNDRDYAWVSQLAVILNSLWIVLWSLVLFLVFFSGITV